MIVVTRVAARGARPVVVEIAEGRDPFEVVGRIPGTGSLADEPERERRYREIMADRARWNADGSAREEAAPPPTEPARVFGAFEAPKPKDLFAPTVGVRTTSLEAYRKLDWSGKLTAQQKTVYDWLAAKVGDATRSEISRGTGLTINATCGRVHELVKLEAIRETRKRRCRVTGENVNALTVAG